MKKNKQENNKCTKKISKTEYRKNLSKIFEKNAEILKGYTYTYTGSLVLFLKIPSWNKLPDDMDVAIDRNNKGIKEFLTFYAKLKKTSYIKNPLVMTVSTRSYTIDLGPDKGDKEYHFQKREKLDIEHIEYKVLETLLEKGNIRIEYNLGNMMIELFLEKNGNGITNLGTMDKEIQYQKQKKTNGKGYISIPFLGYKAAAQFYAMNFLKEVVYNNIYRITDRHSKPKDGMRLNSIITLLKHIKHPTSPKDILGFIQETVKEYSKIPQEHRSGYVQSSIEKFGWIKDMLKKIIKEYQKILSSPNKNQKKHSFLNFYSKIGKYKKMLYEHIQYLQKDMLDLLKRDVLGQKYIITDLIGKYTHKKLICDDTEIKKIAHKLDKLEEYIDNIMFSDEDEGFAYFYEMYMFKNLFLNPIRKALPTTLSKIKTNK